MNKRGFYSQLRFKLLKDQLISVYHFNQGVGARYFEVPNETPENVILEGTLHFQILPFNVEY